VQPATNMGPLKGDLAAELGGAGVEVIAPATHDTGSAVAAVPASGGDDWAYLSSGTWSLIGSEVREPVINDDALECNFTNEGGVDGTFRFLKNISGLWLLQESQRAWKEQEGVEPSYGEIMQMADESEPFACWIEPDDPAFLNPVDMPQAIRDYCRRTEQTVPKGRAALVRCIFESLALKYRSVFDMLVRLHGPINVLHVVGGGSANTLLNQFTANALGVQTMAGPTEATAIGNLLVQAMALGDVGTPADARALVRKSFEIVPFEPKDVPAWEDAYGRWREVTAAV